MDRRFFIKSVGSIVAAVSVPTIAFAEDKYTKSIRLLDLAKDVRYSEILVNERIDDLLVHLFENFRYPILSETVVFETSKILKSKEFKVKDINLPNDLIDDVFPIALVKIALNDYDLPMNPARLKQFDKFHDRYKNLIISGGNLPRSKSIGTA
jgi:hypothetical protein